ncbi:MAG: hypothetical protein ACXWQO_11160 [Bdellovibrionota bacterium]
MNRKKLIVLLAALCLALVFWGKADRGSDPVSEQENLQQDQIATKSAAAALSEPVKNKQAGEGESLSGDSSALPAIAPKALFPGAKIVSREESAADSSGKVHVIETMETDMKQKYVRVEETYIDGAVNQANLVQQNAMVANQLLAQKPEAMAEERFLQILGETGASEIKKVGESFLVTFRAEPENPHALESFIAKVKGAVGELVVEPNYLRRLF